MQRIFSAGAVQGYCTFGQDSRSSPGFGHSECHIHSSPTRARTFFPTVDFKIKVVQLSDILRRQSVHSDWSFDDAMMANHRSTSSFSQLRHFRNRKTKDHDSLPLIPIGRRAPSFGCFESHVMHSIDGLLLFRYVQVSCCHRHVV